MTGLRFSSASVKLTDADVQAVAAQVGGHLPADVAAHYVATNGGAPSNAYWPQKDRECIWIQRFLPMRDAQGKGRTLEETYAFLRGRDLIPEGLVPFAIDFGGNYLAFDKSGKIYFYAIDAWDEDRSNAQNQRRAKRRLCDSLTELLEGLVPECDDDLEDDDDDDEDEDEPDER